MWRSSQGTIDTMLNNTHTFPLMSRHARDIGSNSKPRCNWKTPVVSVRNLRKVYKNHGGEKVAVQNVSFDVMPGSIVGILGPNGAGKSTIVECIAGLRQSDGGAIRVLGIDPQEDPNAIREFVGIQFQDAQLQDKITVGEALKLFASFYPHPANLDRLVSLLKLDDKRDAPFNTLSGGQKQRLSIALALIGKPKIAILDELTTGLDPNARRDTWKLIEMVRDAGVTVLLVTHFMDEAEYLCDQIVVVNDGSVVAQGTPTQLIAETPSARNLDDVYIALTNTKTWVDLVDAYA